MNQLSSLPDYLHLLNQKTACRKLELMSELAIISNFFFHKTYETAGVAILFGGSHV